MDETVLPRTYTLSSAEGEIATISVSDRRLFGLQFDTITYPGEHSGKMDAEEMANGFVRQLGSISKNAGPLRLSLQGHADGISVSDISCSALALTKASQEQQTENKLVSYFLHVQTMAEAWLYHKATGTKPRCFGPPDLSDPLLALEQEILTQISDRSMSLHTAMAKSSLMILPFPGGRRAILAVDQQCFFLAVVSEVEVESITQFWKNLFDPE
ncbi:MAG: hypothetical protein GY952_13120 [Rhodobacteraceae bacterium]|nr:hypothetical protein [Paracoccaceae bacterium]